MHEKASARTEEAHEILDLLSATTEEMNSVIRGLDGGYIPAAPGGDLIRYVGFARCGAVAEAFPTSIPSLFLAF